MRKEHPIIFSTEMVQAILDDRKTQTRRIIKNPQQYQGLMMEDEAEDWCPYGKIDDLLWLRETWFPTRFDFKFLKSTLFIKYKADNNFDPCTDCYGRSWKPSIHMPKWAARIWLRIINVNIERLQEIRPEDIQSEGINVDLNKYRNVAYMSFASLWDSLNSKRGYPWGSNPWVWVIEFEKYDKGGQQ